METKDFLKQTKHYLTEHPHYILKGREVIAIHDLYEWAEWLEKDAKSGKKSNRIVKQDHLPNGLFVSTVFLGVDYNFGFGGKPVLFETMVFDETKKKNHSIVLSTGKTETVIDNLGEDIYQTRYCTYEEAEDGHEKAIKKFSKYDRPT